MTAPAAPTARPRDPDEAVEWLLGLPERDLDNAVVAYVMDRDRTVDDEDVYRHPDVVERVYEAVTRVKDRVDQSIRGGKDNLRPMRARLEREQAATRPLANAEREARRQAEQGSTPRRRAERRLAAEPDLQQRFLALLREERAKG